MPWSRPLAALVGLSVSAFALWLTFHKAEWTSIRAAAAQARWMPLACTYPLSLFAFVLLAARSKLLLSRVYAFTFGQQLRSHALAYVGNTALPMRLGEVLRLDQLSRLSGTRYTGCLASIVIERVLDLGVLMAFLAAAIVLSSGKLPLLGSLAMVGSIFLLAALSLALLSLRPAWLIRWLDRLLPQDASRLVAGTRSRVDEFMEASAIVASPASMAKATALTLFRWSIGLVNISLWLHAFDLELPWYAPLTLLACIAFATALPSTVAFAGTYHFAVAFGLSIFSVAEATAMSIALVTHALSTLPIMMTCALVVGIEAAIRRRPQQEQGPDLG